MLVIAYIVRMNGNYMNTYYTYTEACDERERLERRHPNANITIEDGSYYD